MVLVADVGEVAPKGHDELLNIAHNGLLNHTLIHVIGLVHLHFFHIDKVEQILILEHTYRLASILDWHRLKEIVGGSTSLCVKVFLQAVAQIVLVPIVKNGLMNVEKNFLNVLSLLENLHVV